MVCGCLARSSITAVGQTVAVRIWNDFEMSMTAIVVTARFDSRRLPGKALLDICGRSLLGRVVDRVRHTQGPYPLILATTSRPVDDEIARFGTEESLELFRGDTDDVLTRLIACGEAFDADRIVRISGDSPFIDPDLIERAVGESDSTNAEIVTNVFPRTYPYGVSVEVLLLKTLRRIRELTDEPEDREHVTRYVYENPAAFRIHNLTNPDTRQTGLRLVVDTPEDLDFIRTLCQRLGDEASLVDLQTIVDACLSIRG